MKSPPDPGIIAAILESRFGCLGRPVGNSSNIGAASNEFDDILPIARLRQDPDSLVPHARRLSLTGARLDCAGILTFARLRIPYDFKIDEAVYDKAPRHNYIDDLVLTQLKTLHIPPSRPANDSEFIRRAYLERSKRLHPDSWYRKDLGQYGTLLSKWFQRLSAAYQVLIDEESRVEYDSEHKHCLSASDKAAVQRRELSRDLRASARSRVAILREHARDEIVEGRGEIGAHLAEPPRLLEQDLREHGHHAFADEGGSPAQALEEHAAEREDIDARVDRPLAARLLGGHVGGSADEGAGLGQASLSGLTIGARQAPRQAEVRHEGNEIAVRRGAFSRR